MKDENAVALGRKGGLVTTQAKRDAVRKNLEKARAALEKARQKARRSLKKHRLTQSA